MTDLTTQQPQLLFTSSPEFASSASKEIKRTLPDVSPVTWIDEGVGLVSYSSLPFSQIADRLRSSQTMFVRHVAPVERLCQLSLSTSDNETLLENVRPLLYGFDPGLSFSVQIRSATGVDFPYSKAALNQLISDLLIREGLKPDMQHPQQILSIFLTRTTAFLGVSQTSDNLSSWAGGVHRFAREEQLISRAEFKLLEAIDAFDLRLPKGGSALDLGASPGGWTRILLTKGLAVTAVDPATLDSSLARDPRVTHSRKTAQAFFRSCQRPFDVIVNDMRMDVDESVAIMLLAAQHLKKDGLAVMTFKLPRKAPEAAARRGISHLSSHYQIRQVRQLFHNRNEVSLILRPLH